MFPGVHTLVCSSRPEFNTSYLPLLFSTLLSGGGRGLSLNLESVDWLGGVIPESLYPVCTVCQPQSWNYWPTLLYSAFYTDVGAQSQVLKLAQHALHPLSHLLSPRGGC